MKKINEFFERFKKISVPNESVRKEFQKIIKELYSFEIDFRDIKYQNNKIFFSAPSALKQEIKINEKEILKKINKKLNTKIYKII